VRVSDGNTWSTAEPIPRPNQHFNNQQPKKEDSCWVRLLYIYLFWMYSAKVPTTGEWNVHFVRCELWKEQGSRADTVSDWIPFSLLFRSFDYLFLLFLHFLTFYLFDMKVYHVRVEKGGKAWLIFRRHPQFYELHQKVLSKKKTIFTFNANSRWFSLQ